MYPLPACSLIVVAVIFERCIFWMKIEAERNRLLVDEVLELCRCGNWDVVRQKTAGCKGFVVRIMITGILHREFSMIKAMEAAAADEGQRMRRFMGVLDTMITVAPLLGIFGTVLGIITSFEMLGSDGINNPKAVTVGVAQPLITTATGLGITILSVFPNNYFNANVERAALDIERYGTSLEIVHEKLTHEKSNTSESGQ